MTKVIIDGIPFEALAAITEKEQVLGLMYREFPPPVMFFPYKEAGIRRFWMNQTPSALDVLFCSNNKVISIHDGMPFSTTMFGPNEPADLVVELPKGTSEKYGFHIGSMIQVKYNTKDCAKFLLTAML